MAITPANFVMGLGDATLKIGTYGQVEGSAADVGASEGGAELVIDREYYEMMCDQALGIVDLIKIMERTTLKVTLSEVTLDNLRIAMDYPAGALVGGTALKFGGNATVNVLTLYLNVIAPSGGTRKYTFHKAVSLTAGHSYQKKEKTVIDCNFQILQDTSKTADQQLAYVDDTGSDVLAPTIALTTPADGGTVAKTTSDPVIWTYVEAGYIDENSVVYGDEDGATVLLLNTTIPGSADIEPGTIVLNTTAKTITFTPTVAWNASDTFQAIITTGFKDVAGNHLAACKIEQFSVTA